MKLFFRKWKHVAVLLALATVFVFSACDSDDDDNDESDPPVAVVTEVKLNRSTISLGVNDTTTLTATVNGTNLTDESKKVTWKSSRPEIASVSDGKVTALAEGTAKITVTSKADTTKSAYCDVTVTTKDSTKTEESNTPVVTEVKLNQSTISLGLNDTTTLTATVNGTNLTDESKKVTWKSSRPEIAKVEDGKVTALAEGTARITATSVANAEISAYCDVTVEANTTKESTKNEIAVGTSAVAHPFSYTGSGATIYIYSKSGGLNFYGIKVGEKTWLVSDLTAGTYNTTTDFTSNGITFTGLISGEDSMTIEAKAETIGGTKFASRFKTGGGGSQTSRSLKISVDAATEFVFYCVSSSGSESRTMIVEVVENDAKDVTIVRPSGISLDKTTVTLDRTDDNPSPTATLVATITNASEVTSGYEKVTWTSSDEAVATVKDGVVTAKGVGTATITAATSNGKSATCEVTVTSSMSAKTISLTDKPVGYASLGTSYVTSGTKTEVSTRAELIAAVKKGGIIIVNGMIDMSDGMLPTTAGGSTTKLDAFVKEQTTLLNKSDSSKYPQTFDTYKAFADSYANLCSKTTNDKDKTSTATILSQTLWALNAAYGEVMRLSLVSNTTIVGKDENSGIKGGSININNVENVQVRNLTIKDAYDPFPHHEENDGFNAEWDCIVVQGKISTKNIWIDHCTMEDTIWAGTAANGEKWQTYDGLCDMKNESTNITVSNCLFKNHDKTMLIGSSDSDGDNSKRFISLIGNYFYNCGQRLPMVRNTTLHVLNNYYDASNAHYGNSYAIGYRAGSIIYAENNYFGSGIKYSVSDKKGAELYLNGNTDDSKSKVQYTDKITDKTLFKDAVGKYAYTALSASEAKKQAENYAGAGYVLR